jgi:hypothetical protein
VSLPSVGHTLHLRLNRRLLLALAGAVAAAVVTTALLYAVLSSWSPIRVGDGSEYYAMERTITLSQRPYMTDAGWAGYGEMIDANEVRGMPPLERLREAFPGLRTTSGADFNHFWLYPAGAAAVGFVGDRLGVTHTSHSHFLLLHAAMLAGLLLLCFWTDRWKGVAAAFIIACASPVLWFTNKVHTEFATVMLSTAAMALAAKRLWAAAGLLLALTSTQNISFAIPAFICCLIALHQFWTETRSGLRAAVDALLLSGAALLALVHPAYYFFRFGGITPQLITVGADTSAISPLSSIQYLLDPDIGLLPNWPLGIAIAVVAALLAAKYWCRRPGVPMSVFVLGYVFAAMAAQSATENINSGATINVARYGLWYICLLYPCILYIAGHLKTARTSVRIAAGVAFVLLATLNARQYPPKKGESYDSPTRVSRVIYRYAPWLWTPAPEVFRERYSGLGESPSLQTPAVVLGPGCVRALYVPGDASRGLQTLHAYPEGVCGMSEEQFRNAVSSRFSTLPADPTYFKLTDKERAESGRPVPALPPGRLIGPEGLRTFLGEGWSAPEPWGTWSIGDRSSLKFLAPPEAKQLRITASAFLGGSHTSTSSRVSVNGGGSMTISFDPTSPQPATFTLELPPGSEARVVDVEFLHDSPVSPSDAGVSADGRKISIGLIGLEVLPGT